jgi:hypothetical protein
MLGRRVCPDRVQHGPRPGMPDEREPTATTTGTTVVLVADCQCQWTSHNHGSVHLPDRHQHSSAAELHAHRSQWGTVRGTGLYPGGGRRGAVQLRGRLARQDADRHGSMHLSHGLRDHDVLVVLAMPHVCHCPDHVCSVGLPDVIVTGGFLGICSLFVRLPDRVGNRLDDIRREQRNLADRETRRVGK